MKSSTIKIVYPQRFVTTFSLQTEEAITTGDAISALIQSGLLQGANGDETIKFNIYGRDNSGSLAKLEDLSDICECYIVEGEDRTEIENYVGRVNEVAQKNKQNSWKEEEKWSKVQKSRLQQIQMLKSIQKIPIKKKSSRRKLVTPKKPVQFQTQEQKTQNQKMTQSELISNKSITNQFQQIHNLAPATAKITKKTIINILKMSSHPTTSDTETVIIKYFLGDVLLLQQTVKKMSVLRNKIRELYEVYQDKQLTVEAKKVTIALNDREFYCKRKVEYNKEHFEEHENPEQSRPMFRVSKKKMPINQKATEAYQPKEQAQQIRRSSKNITGNIFNIRRHANEKATIKINNQ